MSSVLAFGRSMWRMPKQRRPVLTKGRSSTRCCDRRDRENGAPTASRLDLCRFTSGLARSPIPPCSWTPEESKVESCEHQDNANIHCEPFPKSVSEEREIYTDYDGHHRHHISHDSYLSAHFTLYSAPCFPSIVRSRTTNSRNFVSSRCCECRYAS